TTKTTTAVSASSSASTAGEHRRARQRHGQKCANREDSVLTMHRGLPRFRSGQQGNTPQTLALHPAQQRTSSSLLFYSRAKTKWFDLWRGENPVCMHLLEYEQESTAGEMVTLYAKPHKETSLE